MTSVLLGGPKVYLQNSRVVCFQSRLLPVLRCKSLSLEVRPTVDHPA